MIEGSVKQYLFGPPSPRQQLPAETDSIKSSSNKVCYLHFVYYDFPHVSIISSLHHSNQAVVCVYMYIQTDVYGLLLPNKCDSPAAKKRKPHRSMSHESHKTAGDIITVTSDPGATATVELRHHDHSSPTEVSSSKRESSEVVGVESGRVSDLVRQFDDTDIPDEVRQLGGRREESKGVSERERREREGG